jgi:hypothetical protein
VHAALCIGLDAVVNDSEENTYEVMQQHKTLLSKLVQETQARQAAEEALNAHLKGQGRSFGVCGCACACARAPAFVKSQQFRKNYIVTWQGADF